MFKKVVKAKRDFVLNSAMLFGSVILVLVFLEIIFQVIDDETVVDKSWILKYAKRNSFGTRDHEYALKKPADKFRIMIVGDSQTAGHGIEKLEDTFPKKLETYLNNGLKIPKFEVINYSWFGWNTDTQLYNLFDFGFKLQPDLILLAYYHNDIAPSFGHPCPLSWHAHDKDLIPRFNHMSRFLNDRSSLYRFIKFRTNRMMEKVGSNPTYLDCLQLAYESRGWEIEKIYLDTLIESFRVKSVHFVFSIIPLLYELEGDYPLMDAHSKLNRYMNGKGVPVLDFYEESFKGLNTEDIYHSKYDRHLNESGAEIIAKTIYDKLKPLKDYRHLEKFSRLFNIAALLEGNPLVKKADELISVIGDTSAVQKISGNFGELAVKRMDDVFIFERSSLLPKGKRKKIIFLIIDHSGKFVERSETVIDIFTNETVRWEKISLVDSKYIFESSSGVSKTYLFSSKTRKEGKNISRKLYIEENIPFLDPKSLEPVIFMIAGRASEKLIFDKLSFYLRYGWVDYLKSLDKALGNQEKSIGTQKAMARIRSLIN